jgi:WXXGXW repeat (2 copies)
MKFRGRMLGAALASSVLLAIPGAGSAQVAIGVSIAPPAPRYEVVPAPRAGYVWAPGAWRWGGGRYVWGGGRWVAARPGYRWAEAGWVHRGGQWHYREGRWIR